MNRRLFLGQASVLSALALFVPAALKNGNSESSALPESAHQNTDRETMVKFIYTNHLATRKEDHIPNFSWVRQNEYQEIENQFLKDRLLKRVSKTGSDHSYEYNLHFQSFSAAAQFLTATSKISSPVRRAQAGYDVQIQIV